MTPSTSPAELLRREVELEAERVDAVPVDRERSFGQAELTSHVDHALQSSIP
jgi:hypothetical protein